MKFLNLKNPTNYLSSIVIKRSFFNMVANV